MPQSYAGKPRDRLPTLFEVLNRRTQSPVDLWSFYVFMREQYRGVDYLDFWLDVVQHLSLCRHYVRGLRQSVMASSEMDNSSRASSVLLDTLIQDGGLDDADSHRLSAFLRGEDPGNSGTLYRLSTLLDAMSSKERGIAELHSPVSRNDNFISRVNANVVMQSRPQNDDYELEDKRMPIVPGPSSGFRGTDGGDEQDNFVYSAPYRGSSSTDVRYNPLPNVAGSATSPPLPPPKEFKANVTGPAPPGVSPAEAIERLFPRRAGDINDGSHFVNRHDIRQSSHRILVTYFIPGAEREIVMPGRIMKSVKQAIEVDGRDDPEVFDEAREYAFQAMEREAFPAFLAARALGNVTPGGSLIRLVVGLLSLFAAFWVAFILIFLDWSPKATRLWLILPFAFGSYGIFSSLYNLDPIMALAGFSEASTRSVVRIKEPYVKQLLAKRSIYVLSVLVLVAAIFVIIFALVPGKRL
jgi:hypothetical protein